MRHAAAHHSRSRGRGALTAVRRARASADLNLDYIVENPWLVIPCSALRQTNIDQVVEWLTARGK